MKKDAAIITTLGLVGFTILSGVVLASSKAMADDSAIDNVNVTVPISCTMSSAISSGEEHTATLNPGTYSGASGSDYENGIGKTTLTTFCNDYNGFSIYAVGYTGDTLGNNTLFGTTASGNATIATKVYQSGDTQSNWSMKVTKVSDATKTYNPANMSITNSFDNWHTVPDAYTKVAEYHASTGSSATDQGQGALGAKVETTYASYIAPTQPADTYSGKVKYIMVHPYTEEPPLSPQPATSGCINYFANASNAVGTMGCQDTIEIDWSSCVNGTDYASYCNDEDWNDIDIETLPRLDSHETTQTLLASNFSRNGYGFAGWSDSFDYVTNPNAKFYGPQETVTFSEDTLASGLSLYAVWIKSQGSIQDQSKVASVCNSLTTAPTDGTANLSSVSALTDQRDNNTYAIARLADGKCWMIENLRLDNTATLTLANTNSPLNDGANVTLKHNYTDTTTSNTLSPTSSVDYNADTAPDGWCTTNSAACDDQSRLRTDNTANRASNPTTNDVAMYSYGNYYNWYSATAGRGTYSFSTNNNSVAGDLCPAGWHLPKGGSSANATNSDFWQLGLGIMGAAPSNNSYYQYNETNAAGKTGTAAFRSYPNNFVYSGDVYGGLVFSRGSSGSFWPSTANSSYDAYIMYLNSSGVYPGTYYNFKYRGRTVRCVAPGV